jgi:uncharacterized protein with FMN-binding domain
MTEHRKQEPPSTAAAPSQWLKGNLVALGSAAVLTVYGAGYLRTRSAAQRFADEGAERRRPVPERTSVPMPVDGVAAVAAPAVVAPSTEQGATDAHIESHTSTVNGVTKHGAPTGDKTTAKRSTDSAASTHASTATSAPVPGPLPTVPAAPPAGATVPATSTSTPPPADSAAQSAKDSTHSTHYRDGTYTGWGTSRHGDIQASVEIKGGRIVDAFVSICLTRYSCSVIAALPPQVVARQSADVDFVSGATQSTNAFYYAVVEALNKAK